jgi:hypothetical protein
MNPTRENMYDVSKKLYDEEKISEETLRSFIGRQHLGSVMYLTEDEVETIIAEKENL